MPQFKYKKQAIVIILLLVSAGLFLRERSYVLQAPSNIRSDELPKSDCGVVLTGSPGRIREAFEVLALKKINKLINKLYKILLRKVKQSTLKRQSNLLPKPITK